MVGKNWGEWKKFGKGGKYIFKMLCILSQYFAFRRKTFAFPRETLRLRTLQLPVVPYVHNGAVHTILF